MKVKMELVLSTIIALYAVIAFPPGYLILTAIVSVAAFIFTESYFSVLGVLVVMSVLQMLKSVLTPTVESNMYGAVNGPAGGRVVGVEGFQPKDPVSIHKRVAEAKMNTPKVQSVQGVLETPSILSALQISSVDPGERGVSRETLPAMLGAAEPIRTPAEGFMPNVASPDMGAPRGNPYLQAGADDEAVSTALNSRATGGPDPANIDATSIGAAAI